MPAAMSTEHTEHAESAMQAAGRAQYREVWPYCRSFALRYGVAIAVVVFAFVLRYWTFGAHDHSFPFLFFVPAAMVAAWFGGLGPGLFAMVAGLVLGDFFFLSDHKPLGSVRDAERLAIGLYFLTTTLCVMLFEQLHEHIRRLEHTLYQLKKSDDETPV